MNKLDDLPVIAGSSLTGLFISDWLTRAKMPHILIGTPPNRLPRLGESIDPAGTLEMLEYYPEYKEFYFRKRWITVFLGQYATSCNFGQNMARIVGLKMMGFNSPSEFIHVDRVGFDQALFERVTSSSYCHRIETFIEGVAYDEVADQVVTLNLQSGEIIRPLYVFDCTNHVRLLGKALSIPVKTISDPQRVVYAHYHAAGAAPVCDTVEMEWLHATNILRLYDDLDGINGLAWCIPLGTYISVGISIPHGDNNDADDEILNLVAQAYARRGIHYQALFPDASETMAIPYQQYFFHDRAYGKNWLLAGPSYGQVWFPSSSGVGTSLVAASIAKDIISRPQEVGQLYQDYVIGLQESHFIFDRMIKKPHTQMTSELVKVESNRIVTENVKRVARLATVQKGKTAASFGRMLIKAVSREGTATSGCVVYQADLPEQAKTIFMNA